MTVIPSLSSSFPMVGCGTWGLGGTYQVGGRDAGIPDPEGPVDFIGHAIDRGIRVFETSDRYGRAEERLGEALTIRPGAGVFIAAKCGIREDGSRDYSDAYLASCLGASLARLGVPHVDLFQVALHANVVGAELTQVMEALARIKDGGRSHMTGLSISTVYQGNQAVRSGLVDFIQVPLNLLDMRMLPVVADAAARGIGVLVKSPLNKGVLADSDLECLPRGDSRSSYLPPDVVSLRRDAARRIVSMAGLPWDGILDAAVRAVLSVPGVTTVLFGMRRREHLNAILGLAGRPRFDRAALHALYVASLENFDRIAATM